MGGGARFPFPREVWSPAGGWWVRPANWKANTAVAFGLIGAVVYATWNFSAKREERVIAPIRPIPSQRWSQQARDMGVRQE
ncbi:hypothetical protein DB88DRAFT_493829 [Papiliotrema laurentii]|uniref:Uncharacterized protein n=1 Tax=Papiliotrema laurentii TaxID=5418 RepID=A0AAD9FQH8_PAPLA|nr:hypothetical protein DB88DRAFT_493829 [Papiliotrema laurentii]